MLLLINVILSFSSYIYFRKRKKNNIDLEEFDKSIDELPFVSILIPAHNEEKVIGKTLESLFNLNYPNDRYEVIVTNDNSQDNTASILNEFKNRYKNNLFKIVTTNKENGGKGKSNALNIAYQESKGEYIAVYDADNTPEKNALKYLVYGIINNKDLGAIIGKFRTINKKKNILTRFINIETLSFQWLAQAGRWQLVKLCTIPGTNFIIRRDILEKIGGWDPDALAEDTEISFQIYKLGYRIAFMPEAVTWEQEPENLNVWFKQRTRWVKGNIYVLFKNIKLLISEFNTKIIFDMFYFLMVYIFFLSSVILSDFIFVFLLFSNFEIGLQGNITVLWIMAYILFVFEVSIVLTMEKGENTFENFLYVLISYFTYSQLWIIVSIKGIISYIIDYISDSEKKWYKTERF